MGEGSGLVPRTGPADASCMKCRQHGLRNPGTMHMDGSIETNRRRIGLVVNHIRPHRGDQALFWDRSNWGTAMP